MGFERLSLGLGEQGSGCRIQCRVALLLLCRVLRDIREFLQKVRLAGGEGVELKASAAKYQSKKYSVGYRVHDFVLVVLTV